ncbi:dipeptidyl peptidase III [Xylariomycetidae sp. FL0641]|nr:dipeptidyl peptidase III [Xylariomycetidae sp. FL0641]
MSVSVNRGTQVATHPITIAEVFASLAEDESRDGKQYRLYAHHLARACWHGFRIILRQTSPEAEGIFDFILELHNACNGQWGDIRGQGVEGEDLDAWLEFAGMFLSSAGNYFGTGGRKAIPNVSKEALRKMARISSAAATAKLEEVLDAMMAAQPAILGYPSSNSQSSYYPGQDAITEQEIDAITTLMRTKKIAPENTRLHKCRRGTSPDTKERGVFEVLQASSQKDMEPQRLETIETPGQGKADVLLRRGDHADAMAKICDELTEAGKYAPTREEKTALSQLVNSFRTGDYEEFRAAQRTWVKNKAHLVEHCMGFLFGYRDPYGARAEWQAAAGIVHPQETRKISLLVGKFPKLVQELPWATPENGGKGPFEPSELDVRDFAIIHVLASVSCTVWEGTNMTIDDTDGKRLGIKSMIFGNRLSLNGSPGRPCCYIHPSEAAAYVSSEAQRRSISTAIHELIGHGTGKLLTETAPGKFNFDRRNPPVSPVTGEPVRTWYGLGETWGGVFGKLASTVEECRATLMASYLFDNTEILGFFGYDQRSSLSADDLIYHSYMQIGVQGLRALRSFNAEDQTWGGDHAQAEFAIFRHLLQDGNGVMSIEHDPSANTIFVKVDRSKILSDGKPSLGRMLCKIHIWHSTADIEACRPFYEALSTVDGDYELWRQVVISNPEPGWKFVQPNTFLKDDGTVEVQEYEASNAGIIQSFAERGL